MTIHYLMNETNSSLYSYVAIERVLQSYEHVHWNVFYQSGDLPAPPWVRICWNPFKFPSYINYTFLHVVFLA
jgi:hypothetical protein